MSDYGYERNAIRRLTRFEVGIKYSEKNVGNSERIVFGWWLEVFEWI